jgi:hypothetical protein
MEKDKEEKKDKDKEKIALNDQVNDPKEYAGNQDNEALKEHTDENKAGLTRSLNEQIGGTDDRTA